MNAEFLCKPRAMETCLHCRGAAKKPAKIRRIFAEVAQLVEH